MNQLFVERIRERWKKLRLCRHRGTVMTDYRILRNYVRIYQALGETLWHHCNVVDTMPPCQRSRLPQTSDISDARSFLQGFSRGG